MQYAAVWSREAGEFCLKKSLLEALEICPEKPPRLISLVGAGGKTTTMYELAGELAKLGKRVLVTTTTHIQRPERGALMEVESIGQLTADAWRMGAVVTAGRPERAAQKPEKLAAPYGLADAREVSRLLDFCDVVLIEADGAARLPAKVPRQGEPVILPQTELVVGCVGLRAVGMTWEEGCFRFASDGGWLKKNSGDRISPEVLAEILADKRGTKKDVPLKNCSYWIVVNQVDGENDVRLAGGLAAGLPDELRERCVATGYVFEDKENP